MKGEEIIESICKIATEVAREEAKNVFKVKGFTLKQETIEKINKEMGIFRSELHRYFKSDEFERRVLEIVFGNNNTVKPDKEWDGEWMIRFLRTMPSSTSDNLEPNPSRSGQPWTDGEVAQLEREVSKLVSKLAGMYDRTPKAIESKCRALGLLGYKH